MGKTEEQIPQKSVRCLSVDYQLTVGRLSAKRLPFVIGLVLPDCRLSVGRLLVKSLLTNSQKIFGAAILQIYQMMVILKLKFCFKARQVIFLTYAKFDAN